MRIAVDTLHQAVSPESTINHGQGGRTNYYWFDLNRDWLPLAHPESQGRLKLFHQWKPNVVLDFHEMGGTSTFFFQPGIPARTNPLTPATNRELTKRMAIEHAKAMDSANELYFTEEQYDDFYMGKGSTYPDLHGAVGVLFEQGSTRGLRLKNELTDRHFRDTVANQVRTSLSSLRGAFGLKSELLEFQHQFYKESLASGQGDPTTAYVLTGTHSRVAAAFQADLECAGYAIRPEELWAPRVIANLMKIDADVRITTEPMRDRDEGNEWPPGTYLILRQPNQSKWKRILTLLAHNATKEGMIAHPIASSLTESGPDLGSTTVRRLPRCNPLLVVGAGTIAYEAGAIWHFLDHKMGQAAASPFSCLILRKSAQSVDDELEYPQITRKNADFRKDVQS